jgi:O-antigen ligase
MSPLLVLLLLIGVILFSLTVWRPAIGLTALAIGVPLTSGLGRGTLIPLLRPNEAMLLIVVGGLLLHHLPRREQRSLTGIDLAITSFSLGSILVAWLVLFISRHSPNDWRTVLSPIQFLVIYLAFSRTQLSNKSRVICVNASMLAAVIVGLVSVAQVLNIAGVRGFLAAYYPAANPLDTRPGSTLGLYSSVGAFELLGYGLALTLATLRTPHFAPGWLGFVMIVTVIGILSSGTWAPAIGLVLATALIPLYGRRLPRQLGVALVSIVLALVLFNSQISTRIGQQQQHTPFGSGYSAVVPETLQYRLLLWQEFFVPALLDHIWFGTGTFIPSQVPERFWVSVDNEYLRVGFRAGLVGLALLFVMLGVIGTAGWRSRDGSDSWQRTLGGVCFVYVGVIALMGFTEEYLSYGGVSQQVGLIIGLFSGLTPLRKLGSVVSIVGPYRQGASWQRLLAGGRR